LTGKERTNISAPVHYRRNPRETQKYELVIESHLRARRELSIKALLSSSSRPL
jgi:hypothetical protein